MIATTYKTNLCYHSLAFHPQIEHPKTMPSEKELALTVLLSIVSCTTLNRTLHFFSEPHGETADFQCHGWSLSLRMINPEN